MAETRVPFVPNPAKRPKNRDLWLAWRYVCFINRKRQRAMKMLLTILLITHIATGFTALLVGLIPMFSKKGSRLHNRAGLVYVYCMITVAITALLLCGLQPFRMMRLFLTGIAVLSFYLCFSGWRATRNKQGQATPLDLVLTYGTLLIGAAMVCFGIYLLTQGGLSFMPIVFTFFGVLTGQFAAQDIRQQQQPTPKNELVFSAFHPDGRLLHRHLHGRYSH